MAFTDASFLADAQRKPAVALSVFVIKKYKGVLTWISTTPISCGFSREGPL